MSKLKEAINAIKAGDKHTGQKLLKELLQENPENETAWLWLAAAVNDPTQKKKCLQRVLKINPDHATAKRGLRQLKSLGMEEEPKLEDIVPQISSPNSVSQIKPLTPQSSIRSNTVTLPTNVQPTQSSQPTLTSSETFSLIAVGVIILSGVCLLLLQSYLQGVVAFTMSLAICLGVFEQQGRRKGRDVSLIRMLRIFVGLVAVGIALIGMVFAYLRLR